MENKSKNVQQMFDGIAHRYDLLNRLLSFRRDKAWRKKAVKLLKPQADSMVLDLACGTGDMILELKRQFPAISVTGTDFSKNMLFNCKSKGVLSPLLAGDAHALPFRDKSFDMVMTAFGFRNVTDKQTGLSEMFRVLRYGGRLCILEFSQPEGYLFSKLYKFYFTKMLPFFGGVISGDKNAYEYLPDSVYKFPRRDEYRQMILNAGFKNVDFNPMTFGICDATICYKDSR